jgi:hypothetical protein
VRRRRDRGRFGGSVEGLAAADCRDDLIRRRGDVVLFCELFGQGFAQRSDAAGWGVVCLILYETLNGRVLDGVGGFEVGLAAVQHMNLFASSAEGHDLVANLDDVGEAYFVEPLGQAEVACFSGHRIASFRVHQR